MRKKIQAFEIFKNDYLIKTLKKSKKYQKLRKAVFLNFFYQKLNALTLKQA
jgi:hypothetical protein